MQCPFHGEDIAMILRHADVRSAAADIETYSSDAPFRVPIPSEESVRTIRQLPIETDPPDHAAYRAITDPFFLRAKKPEVIQQAKQMIDAAIESVMTGETFEAVSQLALPIQSRGLTYLLNMPESESEIWIDWGIHVFKVTGGEFKSGNVLEDYLNDQFDRAESNPSDDFFSALTQATFQGRKLTRDECLGFGNLAFAGGRDTIIHSLTSILAHLGEHSDELEYLRQDPRRITLASEEFFRVFMPLTVLGRVCPQGAEIHGVEVPPDHRIGLCWASANHDETVFDDPGSVRLDRRPNPHVSFGFRNHLCQGAAHARLLVRAFLEVLCDRVDRIEIVDAVEQVEQQETFTRVVGYESLNVRFRPLQS
ncbi:Erythromycin C-12 hydroxylase [Rubripirellula lacrimiformis]|uniref:Erythromycin C-12 hydroxylase n=2 Tax=Rubripirellula lacrimiformis TaxID=1930273 RepID=A0A517NA71_9BACT|nr:Erythromycin C-12 hydroxylase [Rubripirellula lacrimiformis]